MTIYCGLIYYSGMLDLCSYKYEYALRNLASTTVSIILSVKSTITHILNTELFHIYVLLGYTITFCIKIKLLLKHKNQNLSEK